MDFEDNKKKSLSLIQGKILNFEIEFTELKVFKGSEEIDAEAFNLNARVDLLRHIIATTGLKSLFGSLSNYLKLPVSPFPKLERCLGMAGESSYMQIMEGYANIGYDFKVKASSSDCWTD